MMLKRADHFHILDYKDMLTVNWYINFVNCHDKFSVTLSDVSSKSLFSLH